MVNLNNHEGYYEKVALLEGELYCYGEESAVSNTPIGRFVLSSINPRCIRYKRARGHNDEIDITDGTSFCRLPSSGPNSIEEYFRRMLAGRYILTSNGQSVVLHESGRIEGLKNYERYEVGFDFFELHFNKDSGVLITATGEETPFHWRWHSGKLLFFELHCGPADERNRCHYGSTVGRLLYDFVPEKAASKMLK